MGVLGGFGGGYPSIPMIVFGQHELDISSLFKTFRVENYIHGTHDLQSRKWMCWRFPLIPSMFLLVILAGAIWSE